MEQRFFFGLLIWGEGMLTPHYLLFCFIGSLGALQAVAGIYERRDLTPLPFKASTVLGAGLILFAFLWFFTIQPDLFIPGLAGGEFVLYSLVGFITAYTTLRLLMWATRLLGFGRLERAVKSDTA